MEAMGDARAGVTDEVRVRVAPSVELGVRRWPGHRRPAFLLVHGLSSNARLWDETAAVLAGAGHPTDAVDLRSHGVSDSPPDGYDTATAAADLAAVAAGLGLTDVFVVGQSWGGNVALRFAAEQPELVSALGLVDGGWIDLPAEFGSWAACEAALRPPDLDGLRADELRRRLRRTHPDWSAAAIEATVANLRVRPDGRLVRRLPVEHHMRIVRSMWLEPPQPYYPLVRASTLLVPAVPADRGRAERQRRRVAAAAAALPRAVIREYPGADHDLHAQQPGRLAADLLAFADAR